MASSWPLERQLQGDDQVLAAEAVLVDAEADRLALTDQRRPLPPRHGRPPARPGGRAPKKPHSSWLGRGARAWTRLTRRRTADSLPPPVARRSPAHLLARGRRT